MGQGPVWEGQLLAIISAGFGRVLLVGQAAAPAVGYGVTGVTGCGCPCCSTSRRGRGAEASSLAVPIHAAGTGLLQPCSTPGQVPAALQLPPCPGQFTGTLLPGTFLAQPAQLFAVI